MLIHIGDGSANRSYLPTENATLHTNNGEITAFKDWHTDSYYTDFQTSSDKFNTSDNISDTNGTLVDKAVVTDATLGTIVALKEVTSSLTQLAQHPQQEENTSQEILQIRTVITALLMKILLI